jgi:uncharacterized protein (DUF58 family)
LIPLLPARRLLLLLAAAAPLFLIGPGPALVANLLILAAAAWDAIVSQRGSLAIQRCVPARISLGAKGNVRIELRWSGAFRANVRITDDLPPALAREGADTFARTIRPGGRARIDYVVEAGERGIARLGDIHVRLLGPGGLVWRQWTVRAGGDVLVRPGVLEVRRYRMLAQRHRLREAGLRAVRERGEGTSFESLREYLRGDDRRSIDWKATARRGATTVRQYEAERSQNVLLAIDCGRLMSQRIAGRERLDHALSAALLLADVASRHGDRVGVFVFSDRVHAFMPPARGTLDRIADAFARVETATVEPDYPSAFAFLARSLRRRSLLVLFTDVIDARASAAVLQHLNGAKRRHLPLLVSIRNTALEEAAIREAASEPAVYERVAAEELLQARATALAGMRRAGVLVADTRPDELTAETVNRYLEVKRRALL